MVQCLEEEQGVLVTEIIHDKAKTTLSIPAFQINSGQEEQGTAFLCTIPMPGVHRGKENLVSSFLKIAYLNILCPLLYLTNMQYVTENTFFKNWNTVDLQNQVTQV